MAKQFHLDILTPEHSFFSGEVEGLVAMTPDGELCVLAGHVPLVTPLEIGRIRLCVGQAWKEAFISEGFMEVSRGKTVVVTQACEWPEDIDARRATVALERSQELLRQQKSLREHKTNQIALARAMARLRVTKSQDYNLK